MKNRIQYSLIFLLSILLISCGDRAVNWAPTYDSTHTIPYGTYVLRKELETLFPDSYIDNVQNQTIEYFQNIEYDGLTDHYMYINQVDLHDPETWQYITNYVFKGGSAFISIGIGNQVLLNELGISIESIPYAPDQESLSVSILAGKTEKNFLMEKVYNTSYFSNYNPETTDVLGYMMIQGKKEPNLVKIFHGNGYFIMSTSPSLYTNYQMLRKENYQYVASTLSYLSEENIIWDNHRLSRRSSGEKNDGGFFNGLSYILKNESLSWALFLLIAMGLMYLLFNSKRRQKAVPIILPYPNYTLDFAKTLSELYRYNSDHTAMVRYNINYFLDQIKQKYNITAKDTEKDYSELLSSKSGVDLEICSKIVLTIDIFKTKPYLDKEDFYKLQSLIQSFNHKSNTYGRSNSR